ncbi:MAG: glycosyltransferase family 2 protein, partial [Bacteroidota bacterium]
MSDCIQSVLKQDYKNIEVILVDNNSTDGSRNIARYFCSGYENIILTNEIKQGAPAARNKGLALARGELIQFLDSDDLIDPKKISHQVKIFKQYPNLDFIYADYRVQKKDANFYNVNMINDDCWYALLKTRLGCTCSNLWRTSAVKNIGGWNENLSSSQEYDLMF